MASEIQDQLKAAIQLAQQGQRDAARGLLLRVVESDPKQEAAWMWLAVVSTNRDERLQYLERTLALNPSNERALSAYTKLTGRLYQDSASSGPARSVPPRPAPGAQVDWTKPLTTRRSPLVTLAILLVTLGIVAAGIYYFVNLAQGDDDDDTPPQAATLNPGAPGAVESGTPGLAPTSLWTSTPSLTPLPTVTPGPSPTNPWENPNATWTPVPSNTVPPTRTPLPSYTPLPSATATVPITPMTATPRPTRTPTPPGGGATATPAT